MNDIQGLGFDFELRTERNMLAAFVEPLQQQSGAQVALQSWSAHSCSILVLGTATQLADCADWIGSRIPLSLLWDYRRMRALSPAERAHFEPTSISAPAEPFKRPFCPACLEQFQHLRQQHAPRIDAVQSCRCCTGTQMLHDWLHLARTDMPSPSATLRPFAQAIACGHPVLIDSCTGRLALSAQPLQPKNGVHGLLIGPGQNPNAHVQLCDMQLRLLGSIEKPLLDLLPTAALCHRHQISRNTLIRTGLPADFISLDLMLLLAEQDIHALFCQPADPSKTRTALRVPTSAGWHLPPPALVASDDQSWHLVRIGRGLLPAILPNQRARGRFDYAGIGAQALDPARVRVEASESGASRALPCATDHYRSLALLAVAGEHRLEPGPGHLGLLLDSAAECCGLQSLDSQKPRALWTLRALPETASGILDALSTLDENASRLVDSSGLQPGASREIFLPPNQTRSIAALLCWADWLIDPDASWHGLAGASRLQARALHQPAGGRRPRITWLAPHQVPGSAQIDPLQALRSILAYRQAGATSGPIAAGLFESLAESLAQLVLEYAAQQPLCLLLAGDIAALPAFQRPLRRLLEPQCRVLTNQRLPMGPQSLAYGALLGGFGQ